MANLIEKTKSGITTTFNPITIDSVGEDQYKSDFWSVQLRQTLTVTYPSGGAGSDKSDSIMSLLDGTSASGASYEKTRMFWDLFPKQVTQADGTVKSYTAEEAMSFYKNAIAQNPKAKIRQEIANEVELVLNDKQLNALSNDELEYSLDVAETKHRVRDNEGNDIEPAQYRSLHLSWDGEADMDYRTQVSSEAASADVVSDALEA